MIKKLVKDSSIYGVSGLITKGISFLLLPLYVRLLTPQDYGIIDMVNVVQSVGLVLFPMGIVMAAERFYREGTTPEEQAHYSSTAWWFTFVMLTVFALFLMLLYPYVNDVVFDDMLTFRMYSIAVISIVLNGFISFLQSQMRWKLQPKNVMVLTLLFSTTTILFNILFIVYLRMGVQGIFLSAVIAALPSLCYGIWKNKEDFRLNIKISLLAKMLAFSLPLALSAILSQSISHVDRFVVKEMVGLIGLGIVAIALKVSTTLDLVTVSLSSAVMPIIYSEYKSESTIVALQRIFRLYVGVALVVFAFFSVFAHEIIDLLAPPSYQEAEKLVPLLVGSTLLTMGTVFMPGLHIQKKTKHVAVIYTIAAIINLVVNIILIPYWGIFTISLSSFMAAIFITTTMMYFSNKFYRVEHSLVRYLIVFAIIGCVILGLFVMPPLLLWQMLLVKVSIFIGCLGLILQSKILFLSDFHEGLMHISVFLRKRLN